MEAQLFDWLQQSSLVVMALAFLWLVKVGVNDYRHSLLRMEKLLERIVVLLGGKADEDG